MLITNVYVGKNEVSINIFSVPLVDKFNYIAVLQRSINLKNESNSSYLHLFLTTKEGAKKYRKTTLKDEKPIPISR